MGARVLPEPGGGLSVTGMDAWRIASAAAAHYIPIQELTPRSASLENFYLELTNADVQ
jgi:ABC-2 type transport system ATP-binding protein